VKRMTSGAPFAGAGFSCALAGGVVQTAVTARSRAPSAGDRVLARMREGG